MSVGKFSVVSWLSVLLSLPLVVAIDWRGPRDRFWRHHVTDQTLIYNDKEYYGEMVKCLDRHLTKEERGQIETAKADRAVGLVVKDEYRKGKVILVGIERAISPVHVKAVQSLASCVRQLFPELHEARAFYVEVGMDEDEGLGGNNPTHLAPLVGMFFPRVIDEMQRTIQMAYNRAGWSYYSRENATKHHLEEEEILPHPDDIGFRASEHLTYKDFREGLSDHTDGRDTSYTVNFAFSGPGDYDGGYFYLRFGKGDLWGESSNPPKEVMYIKPNKYDCLVFLGGPYLHGVTEMTGGNREMFSSELWDLPDAPFGNNLWHNSKPRMKELIGKCNQMQKEQNTTSSHCNLQLSHVRVIDEQVNEKKGTSDFVVPKSLKLGALEPLVWRSSGLPVPFCSVLGMSKSFQKRWLKYFGKSGLDDIFYKILYKSKGKAPSEQKYTLDDGSTWKLVESSLKRHESDLVGLELLSSGNKSVALKSLLEEEDGIFENAVVEKSQIWALTYSKDSNRWWTNAENSYILLPLYMKPKAKFEVAELVTYSKEEESWGQLKFENEDSAMGLFLGPTVPVASSDFDFRSKEDYEVFLVISLRMVNKEQNPLSMTTNDTIVTIQCRAAEHGQPLQQGHCQSVSGDWVIDQVVQHGK